MGVAFVSKRGGGLGERLERVGRHGRKLCVEEKLADCVPCSSESPAKGGQGQPGELATLAHGRFKKLVPVGPLVWLVLGIVDRLEGLSQVLGGTVVKVGEVEGLASVASFERELFGSLLGLELGYFIIIELDVLLR